MVGLLDMEVSDLAARLRAGLDWWVGELAEMAEPLLHPIGRARAPIIAALDDGVYRLYRGDLLIGRADPDRPMMANLVLPDTFSLVRDIPVPGLSERDWRRILMDEIDRLTPFAASDVYAMLSFTGRPEARTARLAVAPRHRLDAMLTDAQLGGVTATALLAYASDGAAIDLLPAVRTRGGATAAHNRRVWWGVVALLLMSNLGAAIWRDVAQTQRLEAATAAIQPAADRLRRLRVDVDTEVRRRHELLIARRADDPLTVLAALSRALPQGAFAERFTAEGASLRLAGRRSVDIDVAAALRAAGFRQVREAALDITPPEPDAERTVPFDLTFTGLPATVSRLPP